MACGAAHAVLDCDIGGQHVNPSNGSTTAGKTGIMRCKDRDSGLLQREQELRAGQFVGLVRFYDNGRLQKEQSVNAQGNLQGRAREFSPDGKVLFEGEHENGALRGLARRFHPNGQLRRVSFHAADGDREPQAVAEFTTQGRLADLRCGAKAQLAPAFDDARACGFGGAPASADLFNERGHIARATWLQGQRVRFQKLDEQGQVRQSEEVDGPRRLEREFGTNGVKRRERERVVEGREVRSERLQEFSERGSLAREQKWANGRMVSDNQFYLNGQPRRSTEWTWNDKVANISDKEFHDDGGTSATSGWIEQRGQRTPVGSHLRFNTARRQIGERIYDQSGRLTRERAWDDAGKLMRDDEVFEDGSRKAFSR